MIVAAALLTVAAGCAGTPEGNSREATQGPTPENAADRLARLIAASQGGVDREQTAELYRQEGRLGRIVDLNGDETGELIASPDAYVTVDGDRRALRDMIGVGPIWVFAWRSGGWQVVAEMEGSYIRVLDEASEGWQDLMHYDVTDGITRAYRHRYDGQGYQSELVQVFE